MKIEDVTNQNGDDDDSDDAQHFCHLDEVTKQLTADR